MTSIVIIESKFFPEAWIPTINKHNKRSLVLGITAGTSQENSKVADRIGNNSSDGTMYNQNAAITADLCNTNGVGECFRNFAFVVLVVVGVARL